MLTLVVHSTQNRGPTILATTCAVTAISTVFAIARLYVHARVMKKVHFDDYLILFSVVSLPLDGEFLKRWQSYVLKGVRMVFGSLCHHGSQLWGWATHVSTSPRRNPQYYLMDMCWLLARNFVICHPQVGRCRSSNSYLEHSKTPSHLPLDLRWPLLGKSQRLRVSFTHLL